MQSPLANQMQNSSNGHYFMPAYKKSACYTESLQKSLEPEYYKKKKRIKSIPNFRTSFNGKFKDYEKCHGDFTSAVINYERTMEELTTDHYSNQLQPIISNEEPEIKMNKFLSHSLTSPKNT